MKKLLTVLTLLTLTAFFAGCGSTEKADTKIKEKPQSKVEEKQQQTEPGNKNVTQAPKPKKEKPQIKVSPDINPNLGKFSK